MLHKESKRIVGAIKKGATPSFTSPVNVGAWKTFETVVTEVARECPSTFVMLGTTVGLSLYIATLTPEPNETNWIVNSITNVGTTSGIVEPSPWIRIASIEFAENSEQTPFKAIDQVFANGSAYLRTNGLVETEEEEYEFGFGDIENAE